MIRNIINLGDAAAYCDFGSEVNQEINSNVIKYFRNLRDQNILGITNITPSYNKLIISFDLEIINYSKIKKIIENLEIKEIIDIQKKILEVPICFEDNFKIDNTRLEDLLKIKFDKILDIFLKKEYFCYMTGFIAGMPFLGDLNEQLRAKRLETPRIKVPKGSIGITEQFCNIYTYESPGGWNIIGRTPLNIFNNTNLDNPTLINPGDKVKFKRISKDDYDGFK